jgi:hypothetical protein
MMEKSAMAGEGWGGGCTPTPFQTITITYKVAVYDPAERADTLPLFHLHPICTLWFPLQVFIVLPFTAPKNNRQVYNLALSEPMHKNMAEFS